MICSESLQAKIEDMLAQFGVDATYFRSVTSGYNPATGGVTRTETQTFIRGVKAKEFLSQLRAAAGAALTGQSEPRSADLLFSIGAAGLAFVPLANDRIVVDGQSYNIRKVDVVSLGATPIYYTLNLVSN